MIIEIPTSEDFRQGALDMLNLAWSGIIDCLRDLDVADWAGSYGTARSAQSAFCGVV